MGEMKYLCDKKCFRCLKCDCKKKYTHRLIEVTFEDDECIIEKSMLAINGSNICDYFASVYKSGMYKDGFFIIIKRSCCNSSYVRFVMNMFYDWANKFIMHNYEYICHDNINKHIKNINKLHHYEKMLLETIYNRKFK